MTSVFLAASPGEDPVVTKSLATIERTFYQKEKSFILDLRLTILP